MPKTCNCEKSGQSNYVSINVPKENSVSTKNITFQIGSTAISNLLMCQEVLSPGTLTFYASADGIFALLSTVDGPTAQVLVDSKSREFNGPVATVKATSIAKLADSPEVTLVPETSSAYCGGRKLTSGKIDAAHTPVKATGSSYLFSDAALAWFVSATYTSCSDYTSTFIQTQTGLYAMSPAAINRIAVQRTRWSDRAYSSEPLADLVDRNVTVEIFDDGVVAVNGTSVLFKLAPLTWSPPVPNIPVDLDEVFVRDIEENFVAGLDVDSLVSYGAATTYAFASTQLGTDRVEMWRPLSNSKAAPRPKRRRGRQPKVTAVA